MDVTLRQAQPKDARDIGVIIFEGFKSISSKHNFPWDMPDASSAIGLAAQFLEHPSFYGVVAESDGKIVGSNFLDLRGRIAGVGPITVDPASQDRSVGRQLMQNVLARAAQENVAGVRLVQAAYHNRSLALYTKLGFESREQLTKLFGTPPKVSLPGYNVRKATLADLDAANALSVRLHGYARSGELKDAISQGGATIVEHLGRMTGYATAIGFMGHAIGETNSDMKALICAAPEIVAGGFLLPTRNHELFSWCLNNDLQMVHQLTLMTTGLYNQPTGAYLPSVLY